MRKYLKFLIFTFLISLILPVKVKAYLDPGSASYLFQILIAGGLGALFYMKTIIKWVKSIFNYKLSKKNQILEDETE